MRVGNWVAGVGRVKADTISSPHRSHWTLVLTWGKRDSVDDILPDSPRVSKLSRSPLLCLVGDLVVRVQTKPSRRVAFRSCSSKTMVRQLLQRGEPIHARAAMPVSWQLRCTIDSKTLTAVSEELVDVAVLDLHSTFGFGIGCVLDREALVLPHAVAG